MREIAGKAAIQAAKEMKRNAPKQSSGGGRGSGRLKASIKIDARNPAEIVTRTPGGRGGGAGFTAKVVAGEGVPYMRYVVEGTGIYGPEKKMIYPSTKKAMSFDAGYIGDLSDMRDGGNFKKRKQVNIYNPLNANRDTLLKKEKSPYYNKAIAYSTRGQKPNDQWIKEGQKAAKEYIDSQLSKPNISTPPIRFIR